MLFNSFEFALFFPVVTFLYFVLPHAFRWALLLIASCVFYMAFVPKYILILFILILVDYFAGIWIEKSQGKTRLRVLVVSLLANIGILFFFKYFNFFNANLAALAKMLHWNYPIENLSILLPIGLSFHTFQSMGYTIEVYRGKYPAERHLGIYALYVLFYPQLVAGPIERPQQLLPQFHREHHWDSKRVKSGLALMLGGFFKKMVIADQLAVLVNRVYDHPQDYAGWSLFVATLFFAFQILCDFSGYTDIARGASEVMGFKLMSNFHRPYFAENISEFWRRWHISLSSWFRDYVYIPLGGNRVGLGRQCFNLLFVFMLSGLWHGANWTFVIWGALHGVYLILWRLIQYFKDKGILTIPRNPFTHLLSGLVTFACVTYAWIFFRAKNLEEALHISRNIIPSAWEPLGAWVPGFPRTEIILSFILILSLVITHLLESRKPISQRIAEKPAWVGFGLYGFLILLLVFLVMTNDIASQQFIYFQF